jgi:uncharacterized protein YciI
VYVIEVYNLVSNHELDAAIMDGHRQFLTKYLEEGLIVAAGQKVPRDGGIIVVADVSRDRVDRMLAEAPILKNGLARCEVKEFKSSFLTPMLKTNDGSA